MGHQSLVQRWLGGDGSLNLIECPVGFDHSGITHLATHPKLQKILSPYLHPDFPECGNAPNTQKSYSLTLWWHLGLHNISLEQSLVFKTPAFAGQTNQWVKALSLTVSLNWGKLPKCTIKEFIWTFLWPDEWLVTSFRFHDLTHWKSLGSKEQIKLTFLRLFDNLLSKYLIFKTIYGRKWLFLFICKN